MGIMKVNFKVNIVEAIYSKVHFTDYQIYRPMVRLKQGNGVSLNFQSFLKRFFSVMKRLPKRDAIELLPLTAVFVLDVYKDSVISGLLPRFHCQYLPSWTLLELNHLHSNILKL